MTKVRNHIYYLLSLSLLLLSQMENQEDNEWGFYCDIESEEVISQPEKKQQQQQPRLDSLRLDSQRLQQPLPILQKQKQTPSCIQEAVQHVVAICVMATVILFM